MADEPTPLTRRELREQRERQERGPAERQHAEAAPATRRRADRPRAPREGMALSWVHRGWGIGVLWLGTHLVAAVVFLLRFGTNPDRWNGVLVGDLATTFSGMGQLARLPFDRVLPELAAPAVRLLQGLYAVTGGERATFMLGVVGLAILADLVVVVALWRSPAAGPVAAAYWALAVPLLGPVAYARLDIVVVAVVVLAWVLAPRRPLVAGVLLAVATGLGIWPLVVLLPLLAIVGRGGWRRTVSGYAVTGVVLVGISVVTGGGGRMVSPVTRALAKGLGLESVPGLPILVDIAVNPGRHAASLVAGEMQVRGPWTEALLLGSQALVVVPVLVVAGLGIVVLRRRTGADRVVAAALCAAAGLLSLLATAHSLRPEALLWAVPFLAVVAARRPGIGPWWAVLVLLLTQIEYPYLFVNLAFATAPSFDPVAAVIVLRNVGLVAVLVWSLLAAVRAVRELRPNAGVAPGQ